MKERPILFSGSMVRAILAGQKMQTRRAIAGLSEPRAGVFCYGKGGEPIAGNAPFMRDALRPRCPYGAPGDRLWVRETFAPNYFEDGRPAFRADWSGAAADVVEEPLWSPSIFMPRPVSRISLEITAVRAERLHDITEADIAAEGVTVAAAVALLGKSRPKGITWHSEPWTLRDAWRSGWSAINGVESWEANPWVWALSFQRVEAPRA